MLFPGKKVKNLRFSKCWKCTEIINPTITNVIFVSFKILYDPIRRTFLAPGGRRAHPAHSPTPPPPPCLRAWPAVNSVERGKVFVIQTLDKVDSAVSVTLLPGITFLLYKRVMICINISIFSTYFSKKLAGQHKCNVRCLVGHFHILDGTAAWSLFWAL